MNRGILISALMFGIAAFAQQPITDLNSLVGKKAIAQRMPFYEPGTYKTIPLSYAGQEVTIIGFKPTAKGPMVLTPHQLATLNPQMRAVLDDARNAGTLLIQFADGTKADTGMILPSLLTNYLEVAEQPAGSSTGTTASTVPVTSPVPAADQPHTTAGGAAQEISHGPTEPDSLTDAQVMEAIQKGNSTRHLIGLTLVDQQTAFATPLLCDTCSQSGYKITVFTPMLWIELGAARAKGEMMPFGTADVTPEMRAPILHVLALPSTADYLTGPGLALSSSVHRVVLSDTARATTIQPLESENGSIETNSALRSFQYTTASAEFLMSDVEKLRASDPKREFFVVVVGDRQNKFFKVKSKDFKQLFGN